jgi:hypothetical protein
MRGLVHGSTGFDQSVKDDRDDDNPTTDANQPGVEPGASARNHAQEDEPKGAHRAAIVR